MGMCVDGAAISFDMVVQLHWAAFFVMFVSSCSEEVLVPRRTRDEKALGRFMFDILS